MRKARHAWVVSKYSRYEQNYKSREARRLEPQIGVT